MADGLEVYRMSSSLGHVLIVQKVYVNQSRTTDRRPEIAAPV